MRFTSGAKLATSIVTALAFSGCGGTSTNPLIGATTVISGWSRALQRGDVRAAAGYFALPSVFINAGVGDGEELEIRTVAQARFVNTTLSCGARLISVRREGSFFNGRFRLSGRPGPGGSGCPGGVGAAAYVDFAISHGKITAWIRVPTATSPAPSVSGPAPSPTAPTPGPSTPTLNPPGSNPFV